MVFKIKNWRKFQPRTDIAKQSWFRLNNDIFSDEKVIELDHSEFTFFVYLLASASKHNSDIVSVSVTHARTLVKLTEKQIEQCSKRLISLGLIGHVTDETRERVVDVTATNADVLYTTVQNSTLQNKTPLAQDDSDESALAAVLPEFEELKIILQERKVTRKAQEAIRDAFPDPVWVVAEIRKMIAWEEANPSRKKKAFARFVTNWLSRAWDQRKHPKSNNQKSDYSFLEGK